MQLYYVRHGQSENNAHWARTGSSEGRSQDPGLTELGRQQAEHVARFLSQSKACGTSGDADYQNVSGFNITHVYCSLMTRTVITGTHIAQALNLPLKAWKDLHEVGGIFMEDKETGEWVGLPGKNHAYFQEQYPNLILPDTLDEKGWWNRPFEERPERALRGQRTFRELMERHGQTNDRVVLVSHGGFYNYLLAAILDSPRRDGYSFVMNNAAITRIDFIDQRVMVAYMNRTDFLPSELIT